MNTSLYGATKHKECGSSQVEHSSLRAQHSSLRAQHSSLRAQHSSLRAQRSNHLYANGFTLIELMLSLAIMAMIASISVLYLRHQIETERIHKTAHEIQDILQAAQSFYNNTGDWPTSDFQNTSNLCEPSDPQNDPFISVYLPNQNYQDTFGGHYCWSSLAENPNQFWIAIKIPKNDVHFAERIAAEIPNAVTTANPSSTTPLACEENCYVKAAITDSNASENNNGIVDVGSCPHDANNLPGEKGNAACTCYHTAGNHPYTCKVTFTCPANTEPHLTATPTDIRIPYVGMDYSQYSYGQTNAPTDCPSNQTGPSYFCNINLLGIVLNGHDNFGIQPKKGNPGYIGASYIALCVRPKNALPNQTNHLL